ncbi:2-C-methyl-D-erythritol 4-phosphate cytidylyltransferase [Herbaspirillum sp. RTI4]|uniref:2-C-methyl-D-erythritol 4-phosphate cytidylyltransferase n=1 Tax=Herbaspirillum sp. RTI4 TaxID=3048640 RepID=UPI002AB35274|nr:2-C-methyl-D-erythritol 4-phosphate cytidylyltransferase [Herbaspirillum sp. RTI4]MDY7578549.1 2-C-methyl-D-erythritol 4-phosphate cytidylyltransferase [Herbaspirillum sp. RTI4]MEA9981145.1 2-C-methyl-D-erythritol 4-phosphate cytidylyltransferase [Herbaspirillum sp. RTI4]
MPTPRHFALIPAAGVGARMGAACPKQYLPLAGKPMLQHVLDTFAAAPSIAATFVVVSAEDAYIDALLAAAPHLQGKVTVLRHGGASRQETVRNGLRAMAAMPDKVDSEDWILVHDAARPGLTPALLQRLIDGLSDDAVGGLLALPVADTLKRGDGTTAARIAATVARAGLWSAQTPQMFRHALLLRALEQDGAADFTDDASAIEALGLAPRLIESSSRNFKLTAPDDVLLMEALLLQARPHSNVKGSS